MSPRWSVTPSSSCSGLMYQSVPTEASDLDGRQSTVEAEERVREDIIGLHPPPRARVALKHLAGEPQEPVAGVVDEQFIGRAVPAFGEIDEPL
jgi:hypothetical protein